MRAIALLAAAVACLALAAPAGARVARGDGAARVKLLWATVNVCATIDRGGSVGVRGSMPAGGDAGVELYMRFRLQLFRPASSRWVALIGADSGWTDVGSGAARARQAGNTFTVRPPVGRAILLRGLVGYQWREGTVVVRRARRLTSGGHPGTVGARPPAFSAPSCVVG